MHVKVTLDKVANIALIVTCVIVIGQVVYRTTRHPRPRGLYKPGDKIMSTPALDLKKAPRSIVLVTASSCHYCVESMPFYRTLVDAARKHGTRVVAVSAEPPAKNQAFLASHGVAIEMGVSSKDTKLQVRGTPTLILVRSDGTVINSWVGKLDAPSESAVLKAASGG